ncbi:Pre-mRNA-splicing factor 18 [Thelohanellus kitauei]|uniref:Pre-mRNA-splicing factor 18 n=1 Tax=Thelohanellus kitauei TaxID=669202 RepID=A0A0C2JGL2_THEKT|nr:Pre-mRNA-splicing factor 18 [Thelohanellus kitauei]
MDDLLAEIERKRKSLDDDENTKSKKYFKRGDVINVEKEKLVRQKVEKEAQKAKEQLISNLMEAASNPQSKGQTKATEKPRSDLILPREEVIRLLRAKNLPIRLFGETDADSCHRLK